MAKVQSTYMRARFNLPILFAAATMMVLSKAIPIFAEATAPEITCAECVEKRGTCSGGYCRLPSGASVKLKDETVVSGGGTTQPTAPSTPPMNPPKVVQSPGGNMPGGQTTTCYSIDPHTYKLVPCGTQLSAGEPHWTDAIGTGHRNLVVSMAGAGVWLDHLPALTSRSIEVVTLDKPLASGSSHDDQVYRLAGEFVDSRTAGLVGYPWLTLETTGGFFDFDDRWWDPDPTALAKEIQMALNRMGSKGKLILLGKSLGGCKMRKIAVQLANLGIQVDLLILVDASCSSAQHMNETETIPSNVRHVFNFRQDTGGDMIKNGIGDEQSGFRISYTSPTTGQDIVVNKYNSFFQAQLCASDVGHLYIDECQGLLACIRKLVKAELNGDITPILNLLLD